MNGDIQSSPLHGPWPKDPETDSFIARTLRKSIPPSDFRDALADWETGGQMLDSPPREGKDDDGRDGRKKKVDIAAIVRRRTEYRQARMRAAEMVRGSS